MQDKIEVNLQNQLFLLAQSLYTQKKSIIKIINPLQKTKIEMSLSCSHFHSQE